jgi:DeoR/GlpR family transcriptional regulator of sugar metabolism
LVTPRPFLVKLSVPAASRAITPSPTVAVLLQTTDSSEVWLLVDSAKFSRRAFVKFAGWDAVHHVFTDANITPDDLEWLTALVPDVQVANKPRP